jgi:ribosome maturation factor RimP
MSTSDRPKGSHPESAHEPHAAPGGANEHENRRLRELLNPTVEAHHLFLEDVAVHLAGNHRTVSVVVDLERDQSGGVNLDTIADISRALAEVMDADPHDDGRPYDLEVSSPGVGRPLTELRHWYRARGRMVTVSLTKADDVMGRILSVSDEGVTLRPELSVKKGMKPKQGDPVTVPFASIRRGTVEVEFSHADGADPGTELESGWEAAGEED